MKIFIGEAAPLQHQVPGQVTALGSSITSHLSLRDQENQMLPNKINSKSDLSTLHSINNQQEQTSEDTNFAQSAEVQSICQIEEMDSNNCRSNKTSKLSIYQAFVQNCEKSERKLISDLSVTMKCDKYLRLMTSVVKTYRAFRPDNRFNKLYKESVIARRVIRFESKYETLAELLTTPQSLPAALFKLFQLAGDFVDLAAFWLKVQHQGTKRAQKLLQRLEQLQSDCYFVECCIWLTVYCYRAMGAKAPKGDKEKEGEAQRKANEHKLKAVKYLLDVLSAYNSSSLKRKVGEINPKLGGLFTFISSCIGMYILWR